MLKDLAGYIVVDGDDFATNRHCCQCCRTIVITLICYYDSWLVSHTEYHYQCLSAACSQRHVFFYFATPATPAAAAAGGAATAAAAIVMIGIIVIILLSGTHMLWFNFMNHWYYFIFQKQTWNNLYLDFQREICMHLWVLLFQIIYTISCLNEHHSVKLHKC